MRLQPFGRNQSAALQHGAGDGADHGHNHDGQHGKQAKAHHLGRDKTNLQLMSVFQDAAHAAHQFIPKRRQAEHHADQRGAKCHEADHFARHDDLAFFPRLFDTPCGGFFCLVLAAFLAAAATRHGSTHPRQGEESLPRDTGIKSKHGRQ